MYVLLEIYGIRTKWARTELDPAHNNGQAKHCVAEYKRPRRRVVEQQLAKPVSDKCSSVYRISSFLAKMHLKSGERANNSQPHLKHNQSNTSKVHGAEPWIANPPPIKNPAANNQDQPKHHKRNESNMRNQYDVGKYAICASVHFLS